MEFNLPPRVRQSLYIFIIIGSPVVAYLSQKDFIGDTEVSLWSAVTTAIGALAAINVNFKK